MQNMANPWLALSTYEENNAKSFKGREGDTEKVVTMLQQNECVVCYAASGDGKSSLINAGVSPAIRNLGMFPVKISFTTNDYKAEGLPRRGDGCIDFDKLITDKILDSIDTYAKDFKEKRNIKDDYVIRFEKESQYEESVLDVSLWWKLRTETIQVPYGEYDYIPVLIFDQFEEIFDASWKDQFFKWLESLCKDICPDDTAFRMGINPPSRKLFKLLISLRYEYLAELDDWCSQKTFIPQIMQNRYYLRPLSRQQATAVITEQPLKENSSEYCTTLNSIKDDILDYIDQNKRDEIEPVILSVLCYNLYIKASNNGGKLEKKDLNNYPLPHIIRDFYETEVGRIIPKKRQLQFFEKKLVNEDGKRERIKTDQLQQIEFDKDYRKRLEETHLIRISKINKDDYVELVHDTVANVIDEKRLEVSKKKRILWSRIGLLLGFVCIFCFTYWNQFWTASEYKAKQFPYMEYREGESIWNIFRGEIVENATHSKGNCSFQRNLTTLVCDTQEVEVSSCSALKRITVSPELGEKVSLNIFNCNNLEYIEIGDNIKKLTLSITDCPLIQFVNLPNGLSQLLLKVNTPNNINFPLIGNTRYIWKDGILWDKHQGKILYARSDAPEIVNPPFKSKADTLNYRAFKIKKDTIRIEYTKKEYKNLTTLNIPRTGDTLNLETYDSIYCINSIIDKDLTGIKVIKFPSSLHNVSSYVFANSSDLETIDFSACKNIWLYQDAFANCYRLKRVIFPDTAAVFAPFTGCLSIQYVKLPKILLSSSSAEFDCYVDTFDIDSAGSEWRKESDGTITYKEGDLYFCGNAKYHTFEDDEFYSQNGILYEKKDNRVWNIPKEIAKTLKKEVIKRNGAPYYNNCNNEKELFLFPHFTLSKDMLSETIEMYGLAINPINLQNLHVHCSNFDKTRGVNASRLLASIPMEIRQQTTLYVPYNCSWYFINNHDFKGFKEIKEETWYEWMWVITKYHFTNSISFMSYFEISWLMIAILVIFVSTMMAYLMYYLKKRKYGKLSKKEFLYIFLKSLITTFLGPIIWYITYWFIFLSILPLFHVPSMFSATSSFIIAIIAVLVAVMVVYVILYSDGFNLKGMIKSIKDSISVLWQIAKGNPKKAVKIVCLILLPFVLFSLYSLYSNYKAERLQKATIEVEKAIVDAANRDNMALDILHKTWKENFSIIKGEPIEEKLFSAIYSKMVTDGVIDGVDTIIAQYRSVSQIKVLPKGKLVFHDGNGVHLYADDKDTLIYKPFKGIDELKVNDNGTYMAFKEGNNTIVIDLLTMEKNTINNYIGLYGPYGFHPTLPVLAYLDNKAIRFYDLKTRKISKDSFITLEDNVTDIVYNQVGNEMAVASSTDSIFIYRLRDGKWDKVKEGIRGENPYYISNSEFSIIRNDSLIIWPVNKIGGDDEKSSWKVSHYYRDDICFSKDGKFALTREESNVINVLDLTSSDKVYLKLKVGYGFKGACLSEDGKSIYVSDDSVCNVLVKIPILNHDQIYDILERQYNEK